MNKTNQLRGPSTLPSEQFGPGSYPSTAQPIRPDLSTLPYSDNPWRQAPERSRDEGAGEAGQQGQPGLAAGNRWNDVDANPL